MFQETNQQIYPVFDRVIGRPAKEGRLNQRAKVIWLTGLSGSGKTTLALALEKRLFRMGYFTQILDGDNIRSGINTNLGFSEMDRIENIRRIAEISKLIMNCGVIVICACISPTEDVRQMAYKIIGRDDIIEIFVDAPLEVCESRDTKGLYAKARAGLIQNFTGINAPFEKPFLSDLHINTSKESPMESLGKIVNQILPQITS
jgi:adenylylsulfate kinase